MRRLLIAAVAILGLSGCGDENSSQPIDNPKWTVTIDPYEREWACMYVDGYQSATMFCVPAPSDDR